VSNYGLKTGNAELASAGPIAFGPDGILFLADSTAARVLAVEVGGTGAGAASEPFDMTNLDTRVASYLGCEEADVAIRDMAVHPGTQQVYLSVQRGRGEAATAVLLRIDPLDATIAEVPLAGVAYSEVTLEDAPDPDDGRLDTILPVGAEGEELTFGDRTVRVLRQPIRTSTVTDMAYVDGELLVAGLSNEEFSSKLRRIPFPFGDGSAANSLEIYHVSHGKWETAAPIRAFVPYEGGRSILATYTCTPVVHFSVSDFDAGTKVVGRTVAELGSMNQPLDMVSFEEGGEEHLLVANTRHGLVKIDCRDIDGQEPLTQPQQPVGVPRETKDLQGIIRLANLDSEHVLALQRDDEGHQHLRTLKTASL
jgi:hypothetical protein